MVNPLLCVVLTPCTLCVHIIINSEPGERVHKPAFSHFPWFHSVSPFSSQVSAKGGKAGAGRDKVAHSRVTRRRDGGRKPRYCQRWRELFGPHAGVSVEYIH